MKYAKKPKAVEAEQYRGPSETHRHLGPSKCVLERICFEDHEPIRKTAHVHTIQGAAGIEPGDWVLYDEGDDDTWPVNGELFAKNYEPA